MKEHPILFSSAMVCAILEGNKTQTRRVLRDQNPIDLGASMHGAHLSRRAVHDRGRLVGHRDAFVHCPYGVPGDRLWVRETFMRETEDGTPTGGLIYRATNKPEPDGATPLRWTPAIHMPRTACRLRLEVTTVRVERLQDITEDDAFAEGCFALGDCECTARRQYQLLWDDLNAARGFGWQVNPWVWVITFKRTQ